MDRLQDIDPLETREWVDSLEAVLEIEGPERAHYILEQLVDKARRSGAYLPYRAQTAYLNTIPTHLEERIPGDQAIEQRLRSLVRWNAVAMVLRAGKKDLELGGHIASFASAATLYDVGFNHFWNAPGDKHGGDLIYCQGHSSPGVYARSFLEGRLTESQLDMYRQEVDGKGISSYPHPWLMPDFWQFPTVFDGLGTGPAIYRRGSCLPRGTRDGQDRGSQGVGIHGRRRDGRARSLGAIGLRQRRPRQPGLRHQLQPAAPRRPGARQRRIIQELEATFRGAGWG